MKLVFSGSRALLPLVLLAVLTVPTASAFSFKQGTFGSILKRRTRFGRSAMQAETQAFTEEPVPHPSVAVIGCGYVGSAVGRALRGLGVKVEGTTTREEGVKQLEESGAVDAVVKIPRNIGEGDQAGGEGDVALEDMIKRNSCVFIAVAPGRGGGENAYRDTYAATSKRVAAALAKKKDATQILYISSSSVYGNPPDGRVVTEETYSEAGDALSDNQKILRQAEETLLAVPSPHKVAVLRLAGLWGPGRPLGMLARRVAGTEVPGTGETFVNFSHLDDITGFALHAMRKGLCGAFNVCSVPSIRKDLYDAVCEAEGLPPVRWSGNSAGGEYTGRGGSKQLSNQKAVGTGYAIRVPDTIARVREDAERDKARAAPVTTEAAAL